MYNKITQFEWDQEKAQKNWRKRGITFEQAKYTFDDPFAVHLADDAHSDNEERFISARRANPAMHRMYANEE